LSGLRRKQALDYVQANVSRDIHLDELARDASLSSFHSAKLFKQTTGASLHLRLEARRYCRESRP
jgi:AraC family transcriptional regulator